MKLFKEGLSMKTKLVAGVMLVPLLLAGCDEEKRPQPQPAAKVDATKNPRLSDLNPGAWQGVPMKVVIADFQEADGIYSSFICDELRKRLATDAQNSLRELNGIDPSARSHALGICLSAEVEDSTEILKAVEPYREEFPAVVGELTHATN